MRKENLDKGFTLIEILVALGIMVMMISFSIITLTSIPKTRMKSHAQTIKSEFELTREFAKSHGGQAIYTLKKTNEGIDVIRTGKDLTKEHTLLNDRELKVFYKITGDVAEYCLGDGDYGSVTNAELKMTFSQTEGKMIGPHMVDSLRITNGSKEYVLYIKQDTGMMYFDYELPDTSLSENAVNANVQIVETPYFIEKGLTKPAVVLKQTGKSIQPEIKYDARYVKIGGVYRAIEPGLYTIIFKLKNPYNTTWDTGGTEDKALAWRIIP